MRCCDFHNLLLNNKKNRNVCNYIKDDFCLLLALDVRSVLVFVNKSQETNAGNTSAVLLLCPFLPTNLQRSVKIA